MTDLVPIKFGTDGWRAVIAREYTFANLERVAQAYADHLLQSSPSPSVVIVYDRRFLSELFAQRAGEVSGNGRNERVASQGAAEGRFTIAGCPSKRSFSRTSTLRRW